MGSNSARWILLVLAAGTCLLLAASTEGGRRSDVAGTQHNLSVSGPGPIVAVGETEICIFCHTPHSSAPIRALWNRELPTGTFITYRSPSMDVPAGKTAPQPDGASKLCLSCHDGTLALGAVLSRKTRIPMRGTTGGRMPRGSRGFVGRDLSGMHPISFAVTRKLIAANNAKDSLLAPIEQMRSDPDVRLDKADKVQCTTCHDPHDDSNYSSSGIHFYHKARYSDVCLVCHKI